MAAPGKAAEQLVGFGLAANELGIGWVSVWALQIYDSAIWVCENNLDLMRVFMASGGLVFFFFLSVLVYKAFGLQNKLREGPLHNEKARGCFFSPPEASRKEGSSPLDASNSTRAFTKLCSFKHTVLYMASAVVVLRVLASPPQLESTLRPGSKRL